MRILTVEPGPAFSVADVHRGWTKAFGSLGCEVVSLNLGDRLDFYSNARIKKGRKYVKAMSDRDALHMAAKTIEWCCYDYWPDVVFVTSGFFLSEFTLTIMRQRGHKVVLLHTESPYEDDRQLTTAAHADLNLVNDPTNLERFREVAPTEYQWHCYDPDIHHPKEPQTKLASDFGFVGTGYPSRVEFFEQVDWTGIDACFAGNWNRLTDDSPLRPFVAHNLAHCLDNEDAVDLYSSTKVSANIYRTEAERPELEQGWAMGPREVELAACGTFFLTQARGENREELGFVPTFDSPEDFSEKLRWWLDHPDARQVVANRARDALADRTFENAARRLLGWLS